MSYLFCLAVNPLSWRLRSFKGYRLGERSEESGKVTHTYYIDDLKVFAENDLERNAMMDVTHVSSEDMGLGFGYDKCAGADKGGAKDEVMVLRGGAEIQMSKSGETYKFLGLEEGESGFDRKGTIEKAMFAEKQRLHLIWGSDLSGPYKMRQRMRGHCLR